MFLRRYLLDLATDQGTGFFASLAKIPLFLLSLVYGMFVRVLSRAQSLRPFHPGIKVISVGNITLGGTGKTMLVEYIAHVLSGTGHPAAVLTRGYKKPRRGRSCAENGYEALGDEGAMLKRGFPGMPVLVDPDRVRSARLAAAQGCAAVILDDGFQQWRIRKDLDIVCVDARGFGNGCCIPRGLLREPLSALRRAQVFVITNRGLVRDTVSLRGFLAGINPRALIVESGHQAQGLFAPGARAMTPAEKIGAAALVCGIGNPDSFFNSCREAGIDGPRIVFPDHHAFTASDFERIAVVCRGAGARAVVITRKDEARLSPGEFEARGLAVYVLRVTLRIKDNEQEFIRRLRGLFPA